MMEKVIDANGLDAIEALVADATAVEGVAAVHEGSGYFAERVIRRAVEQGNLVVTGPANHPAFESTRHPPAPLMSDENVVKVARALCKFEGDDWEREGPIGLDSYRKMARAALQAISPSEKEISDE